jgi:hypothetical protein
MGVIVMMAAVFGFWRFVSHRAAFILIAFLAFGVLAFWIDPDERPCGDRAWFCPLLPDRVAVPRASAPEPCPPDEPIGTDTRIFQSDAANAEVQRMIQSGVCQQRAIDRVAKGWKAQYDPAYASGLHKKAD